MLKINEMKRSGLKLLAQRISRTAILAGDGRLGIPGHQKGKLSIKQMKYPNEISGGMHARNLK